MLVLSRKVGERIHIGNDIFLEVRRVAGSRVTLAIDAPKTMRILRGELMEAAREFDVLEETADDRTESAKDTMVISGPSAKALFTSKFVAPSMSNVSPTNS